jgi:hypothetical protein
MDDTTDAVKEVVSKVVLKIVPKVVRKNVLKSVPVPKIQHPPLQSRFVRLPHGSPQFPLTFLKSLPQVGNHRSPHSDVVVSL